MVAGRVHHVAVDVHVLVALEHIANDAVNVMRFKKLHAVGAREVLDQGAALLVFLVQYRRQLRNLIKTLNDLAHNAYDLLANIFATNVGDEAAALDLLQRHQQDVTAFQRVQVLDPNAIFDGRAEYLIDDVQELVQLVAFEVRQQELRHMQLTLKVTLVLLQRRHHRVEEPKVRMLPYFVELLPKENVCLIEKVIAAPVRSHAHHLQTQSVFAAFFNLQLIV